MKLWLTCLTGVVLALASAAGASAQTITVPDGKYASGGEYLIGNWKWERAEPRQTMIMRFGRDGSFYYHNLTTDLQHWGSYTAEGGHMHISVARTCESTGANCENRTPPLVIDYAFAPTSANVFMSASERWERLE